MLVKNYADVFWSVRWGRSSKINGRWYSSREFRFVNRSIHTIFIGFTIFTWSLHDWKEIYANLLQILSVQVRLELSIFICLVYFGPKTTESSPTLNKGVVTPLSKQQIALPL